MLKLQSNWIKSYVYFDAYPLCFGNLFGADRLVPVELHAILSTAFAIRVVIMNGLIVINHLQDIG